MHLHGFYYEQTLAGFYFVSCLDEQPHYFPWHGGDDLLAPFGFQSAVTPAAPGARIENFGDEFVVPGLQG